MELARVGRMEHLAFASEATLEQLCATIEGALLLPEMQLDFENETGPDAAGQGAARYVVIFKGNPVPRVVYAEYPGAIVTAIQATGVPYAVASE
ncbi:MAG TPA: hypothetical protein VF516_26020 [Kofleriaceae bacterium]